MTPRVPPYRHQPAHLVLTDAVAAWHPFHKKPCLSDRSTAPPSAHHADAAAAGAETTTPPPSAVGSGGSFRLLGLRKRRRRGGISRSVSGRSSDRRRSGTCSDFHVTCGPGGTAAGVELASAESGYGSEPGYRGDVELGYGDEIDEEEEDGRQQVFFWGGEIGGDEQVIELFESPLPNNVLTHQA
ncbi:unnamed protein product [Triticum turgidum subsp. durum]|uniref:Uncharacterized protein n=1 Tax=Triticum turgidum subsp. durum TaxID=4567 RepID=A0A9R0RIN5_TRITD|nr:unnamed protein product [Triticum turgidum subsp. durum]